MNHVGKNARKKLMLMNKDNIIVINAKKLLIR